MGVTWCGLLESDLRGFVNSVGFCSSFFVCFYMGLCFSVCFALIRLCFLCRLI